MVVLSWKEVLFQSIEPVPRAPRETVAHEQARGVAIATTGVLRNKTSFQLNTD